MMLYAVKKGKSCNGAIFLSWDDCKVQVEDYKDAEYKTYNNFDEACKYIQPESECPNTAEGPQHPDAPEQTPEKSVKAKRERTVESGGSEKSKRRIKKEQDSPNKQQIISEEKFDSYIAKMRTFSEEHGHCRVPQNHKGLGVWVNTQRKNYKLLRDGGRMKDGKVVKRSSLTAKRVQQLNDVGFQFSSRALGRNPTWEERVEELRQYKEENSTCRIDRKKNKSLACWSEMQISQFRKRNEGLNVFLTDERIQILSDIGFEFPVKHVKDVKWGDQFELLRLYKQEHGHCDVPKKYTQNGLGHWVANQRKYHKKMLKETPGSETEQSDERLKKLLDLGFNFSVRTRRYYKKPEPGDFPEECLPPDPIALEDSFPTGNLSESFIL
mmetsp:Transcript_16567/g.19072  ORF Transcript_16567/g.19072 Transcript_16567/m.19072 type:complete len:382 (+) Transcript_16567:154-1299(+)|eukprot:CAMPEP_0194369040 /NCGR_PEP_ID=MMETSP0174-20130528/17297_1 /TAXON_ID=216777 /ORGANISM="Proboscia alata, Strain PI-D3" /LENGTH=381 /DNA_ID=CAMNT_0039145731 /DNA_START=112 /DNA_END=1257 /DNA_ORIENTATION=-